MTLTQNVRKFVIFAHPRSGTNMFMQGLGAHPKVTAHYEIMSPFAKFPEDFRLGFPCTLEERDADPSAFLQKVWAHARTPVTGFKIFYEHNNEVLASLLDDPTILKIAHYRRNHLRAYISWKISMETRHWFATRQMRPTAAETKIVFDAEEWQQWTDKHVKPVQAIVSSRSDVMASTYEDLARADHWTKVYKFLNIEPKDIRFNHIKTQQKPLRDVVTNFGDMEAALVEMNCAHLLEQEDLPDLQTVKVLASKSHRQGPAAAWKRRLFPFGIWPFSNQRHPEKPMP